MSIDAYHQKYGKMLDPKEVSVTLPDGRVITFETGRIAKQARGAAVAKMGDAFVLSTVCYGEEKEGDFFPLTVEYREKAYAAGRLPGGYSKREAGRPLTKKLFLPVSLTARFARCSPRTSRAKSR